MQRVDEQCSNPFAKAASRLKKLDLLVSICAYRKSIFRSPQAVCENRAIPKKEPEILDAKLFNTQKFTDYKEQVIDLLDRE